MKIVENKQSVYILVVTLLIAGVSFATIHGINATNTTSPLPPPENIAFPSDSSQNLRVDTKTINDNLGSAVVAPPSENEEVTQAGDAFCKIAGCSNELCIPVDDNSTVSSCISRESNKCYVGGDCRIQSGGKCGWSVNATLTRCLADSNFATQKMRVMEIRYFYDRNNVPNNPNLLSFQLQNYIKNASAYHKYKDAPAKSAVEVEVVQVIDIDGTRENVEDFWYGSYYKMIQDLGLCQIIEDNKIDQIWMWVDPREPDGAPGLENVLSSKYLLYPFGGANIAQPPFCEGKRSFVIMGFDYTRTSDLALHSFSHYMETLAEVMQGYDLFWNNFVGPFDNTLQGRYACGDVHFPPNATFDYSYENTNAKSTYCENWNPQGTGALQSINCIRWGCNQQGYLQWWMQNMPGFNNTLTYDSKKLPPWWDFTVDFDSKVKKYIYDNRFYTNSASLVQNDVDITTDCSCDGTDSEGQPVTVNQCFANIIGVDSFCYQCVKDRFYRVPQLFCNN